MQKNTDPEKIVSVLKQNGYGGGASQVIQQNGLHPLPGNYKV